MVNYYNGSLTANRGLDLMTTLTAHSIINKLQKYSGCNVTVVVSDSSYTIQFRTKINGETYGLQRTLTPEQWGYLTGKHCEVMGFSAKRHVKEAGGVE